MLNTHLKTYTSEVELAFHLRSPRGRRHERFRQFQAQLMDTWAGEGPVTQSGGEFALD